MMMVRRCPKQKEGISYKNHQETQQRKRNINAQVCLKHTI